MQLSSAFFQLFLLPSLWAKFLMRLTPMNLFNFSAPQNVIKFNATLACADPLPPSPSSLLPITSQATQNLKAGLNLTARPFVRGASSCGNSRPRVQSCRLLACHVSDDRFSFGAPVFMPHHKSALVGVTHNTHTHTNTHTSHTHTHRQTNICMSTMLPSIVYSR